MSKRVFILVLALALAVALVFTGCTTARRPYYDNNNAAGNRTGYTGTGYTGTGTGYGTNTLNNTGAGANPGTTGYGTGNGIGTGYGTPSYRTVTDTGAGTNRGYDTGNYTSENNSNRTAAGYGNDNGNGIGNGYGMGANTGTGIAGVDLSNRIATAVRQIQGIQNVTVVVTGDTAYVGINMAGNTNPLDTEGTLRGNGGTIGNTGTIGRTGTTGTTGNITNTTDIQRRVSQVVRAIETSVDKVYVSNDASFVNRLRTMDQGMRNGNVTNGFTNDLRNLVNGMTPTR